MDQAFCLLPESSARPAVGKKESSQAGLLPRFSLRLASRYSWVAGDYDPVSVVGKRANPLFIDSIRCESLGEMNQLVFLYLGENTEGLDKLDGYAVIEEESHAASLVSN